MQNEDPQTQFILHSAFIILHSTLGRYQLSRALRQADASRRLDLLAALELAEGGDGGLDKVLGAGGAVGLGQDVGDAGQLHAGAHALAGGDAGARAGRGQHDGAGPAGALDLVRDRGALEVDLEHVLPGVLGGLLDGRGHLVGLAVADADVAAAVAGDDERAEGEGAAALDDLGAAVDADDGRLDAGFVSAAVTSAGPAAAPAALPAASARSAAAAAGPAAAAAAAAP